MNYSNLHKTVSSIYPLLLLSLLLCISTIATAQGEPPNESESIPTEELTPEAPFESLPFGSVSLTAWDGLAYGETPPVDDWVEEEIRGAVTCQNINDPDHSDHGSTPNTSTVGVDLDLAPLLIRFVPVLGDPDPRFDR